ncbi:G-protein coupled receptor 54-like [Diadema setosum]|uniref:G-protein coupled receptor 54-like n=1 Tax=Diadema setosum TaxID=31175 RepID=UPI003B3AC79F
MASDADLGSFSTSQGPNITDGGVALSTTALLVMQTLPRILLILIAITGLVGNSIVIYIIGKHRDMRTVTNYFVANLAIADITFLIFCVIPTVIVIGMNDWPLGAFMCRATPYIQYASVQATCLTLTAMTIDRYYLIVHAVKSRNTRTTFRAIVINVTIWACSFLVHLPQAIFTKIYINEINITSCEWKDGGGMYTVFSAFELYVIPLAIIMACYVQILLQVWQKTSGGTESAQAHARALRRKKKITRMVFIVVILFALCWAPIHIFNILDIAARDFLLRDHIAAAWLKIFFLTLAYANSCINPFVYAFTTTSFKKYFKTVFGAACGHYSREGHTMSISMETKSERISANPSKDDSSL